MKVVITFYEYEHYTHKTFCDVKTIKYDSLGTSKWLDVVLKDGSTKRFYLIEDHVSAIKITQPKRRGKR